MTLQAELQARRQELAERLVESKVEGRFPRSMTMRVLMHRPELAGRFLTMVAGARVARSVSALLVVVQMARAARTRST